jgi:hypothetical protein
VNFGVAATELTRLRIQGERAESSSHGVRWLRTNRLSYAYLTPCLVRRLGNFWIFFKTFGSPAGS